jgi:hypothetical protein
MSEKTSHSLKAKTASESPRAATWRGFGLALRKTVWFGMLSKLQLVKTFIETSATQVNKSPDPYTDKKRKENFPHICIKKFIMKQ